MYWILSWTEHYRKLLIVETKALIPSLENKITKDDNGENLPHLEFAKVILVHCNNANNDYQQYARVLYTFVPNKLFHQLLEISPTTPYF